MSAQVLPWAAIVSTLACRGPISPALLAGNVALGTARGSCEYC